MKAIDDNSVAAANARGAALQAAFPAAVAVRYDSGSERIVITLATGLDLAFSPQQAQGFEHVTAADLDTAEISPSGLGVHFPKIDADIYIPALIEGFLGAKRWMAAQNGKLGGKATTPAKGAAARANGKLGGRPRKSQAKPGADDNLPDAA
ncbi:MAG: hypothetical protein JWP59_2628 [Massilia sp.]|nr:hypothetical protein [Massilia sp.]